MEFKGDVIITDPCYIIKDNENNDSEEMPEVDYYMNPDDNLGNPTREIYDGNDRLLYNNVDGNV